MTYFIESPSIALSTGIAVRANIGVCTSGLHCAQRNGRATGENPEGWEKRPVKGEHKWVEGIRLVGYTVKRSSAVVTIQQHANALWNGIGQNGFCAVMPSWQLDVKPLHTPWLGIAAQTTGGTFAVHVAVSYADANKVAAAQLHFPVKAPSAESLWAEHLRAYWEAFRGVRVVQVLVGHGSFSVGLAEHDAFVGRPWIQGDVCEVWWEQKCGNGTTPSISRCGPSHSVSHSI